MNSSWENGFDDSEIIDWKEELGHLVELCSRNGEEG